MNEKNTFTAELKEIKNLKKKTLENTMSAVKDSKMKNQK